VVAVVAATHVARNGPAAVAASDLGDELLARRL
jgi:hypothetical protein